VDGWLCAAGCPAGLTAGSFELWFETAIVIFAVSTSTNQLLILKVV
jgi:hypothetical protein